MKKILTLLCIMTMLFTLVACNGSKETLPNEDGQRNLLYSYVDGQDVSDGKNGYDDIKTLFTKKTVGGKEYYATTLTDFCPYDISSVKGVFITTTDGFVKYYDNIDKLYLTSFDKPDGTEEFVPVKGKDGNSSYGVVLDEENASEISGLENIYMVTSPATFEVSILVNGTEVGKLTMNDFMKKTQVGENKVSTAMYDGSFKYNGGDSTWTGKFLGIDMDTMIAKLSGLSMDVPNVSDCKKIEMIGYIGMGVKAEKTELNQNYSNDPTSNNYFGNIQFYCMYDGYTKKEDIKETELGLTCFINGTGSKWITYNLESINFVTEE